MLTFFCQIAQIFDHKKGTISNYNDKNAKTENLGQSGL